MKKHNTLFAWKICLFSLLFLLASLFTTMTFLFFDSDKGQTVEIENYMGLEHEDLVFPAYLEVRTEYRYAEGSQAGKILSQSPAPGSRRKLSSSRPQVPLTLYVSLGTEEITVPTVIGKPLGEELSALRSLGFSVETVLSESAYPSGVIYECSPRPGTVLPKGSRLVLHVSMGEPNRTVEVPDLSGLSRSEAMVALWLSELSVGETVETDGVPPTADKRVISQSHPPGTRVRVGTAIALTFG